MKNYIMTSMSLLAMTSILSGCAIPSPFTPKALNENAKGITTSRSTPYGCKSLGEIEGIDGYKPDTITPMLSEARTGALNDLRNNAVEAVGEGKRITLRIIEEKPECISGIDDCRKGKDNNRTMVYSYRIVAQIFECGNK
ncbi:hypothetical protein RHO08_09245 [Pasteurella multocida]|uniref:hypothetical protein n=1 Tax=Pasteurella multocida TaxID=747 RepID=UPI002877337E|nr:hypothetical protein [Pasteurella multocida]WND43787.1 hypothetical protein RHO08_09245 [Pasteurella multocida]HDR1866487.1 hypothetical protein [Pasteurella multocida]